MVISFFPFWYLHFLYLFLVLLPQLTPPIHCYTGKLVVGSVRINFSCQYNQIWRYQISGKALIMGVSLREFLEETGIWISGLSKANIPLLAVVGHHPISWALRHFSLPVLRHQNQIVWFSGLWILELAPVTPNTLRPMTLNWELYHQLSWFWSLNWAA